VVVAVVLLSSVLVVVFASAPLAVPSLILSNVLLFDFGTVGALSSIQDSNKRAVLAKSEKTESFIICLISTPFSKVCKAYRNCKIET
jgi:hypothetical protein